MSQKNFVTFLVIIFLVIFTMVCYFENSQASQSPNASSCWTSGKKMPTARIEMASATVGDKIYVIGGYSDKTTNIVEVYDSTKD